MAPIKGIAARARANRKPVSADNPFLAREKTGSEWITTCLESWGQIRDAATEAMFLNTYGSPLVQAVVGLNAQPEAAPRKVERDVEREAAAAELRSALESRFEAGGVEEGALRTLIYIRSPDGAADERGYPLLKSIRASKRANKRLTLAQFRDMLTEQLQLIRLDEERAVNALPKLIQPGEPEADAALRVLRELIAAPGPLDKESRARAARVQKLIGAKLVAA
jgi:hypothetical protein